LFTLGAFSGKIVFGHGLGDIFYTLLSLFAVIVYLCVFAFINFKEKDSLQKFIAVIFTVAFLSFCLKATVFRGAEYSWQNHGLFYR
jgi:hypothetical protein